MKNIKTSIYHLATRYSLLFTKYCTSIVQEYATRWGLSLAKYCPPVLGGRATRRGLYLATRYSLLATMFILCININAQESRAEYNPDYNFQQGRKLFDQKQYAVSSQYFTYYLNQQNDKEVCELCQEAEYYIAINAYKLRDKNTTDILEAYLEKYPYTPMRSYINFLIGHSYYDRAKFDEAMKYYNQVNDLHLSEEDAEEYLFTKGYTLLTEKKYKEASRCFYALTGFNKKYKDEAEYYYAYCEFSQQNYTDAIETFINIEENSKFYEAAQFHALQIYDRLQYRTQAVELGKKLVKQFPRSKYNSEAYRILGENSYFQQNWHDAVEFLKLYAKNQKQVQRADMYMLGIANYMVANYPDAITYLGKVTTEQDSLAQNAYIFIGHANLQQHQADKARMAFQNASLINADSRLKEESLYNYALATYESKAPFGETIKAFDRFINEYPNSTHLNSIYELMVNVFLTDKNYLGAVEAIDNIKNPTKKMIQAKEQALFNLGIESFKKRRYDKAIEYFTKSTELYNAQSFSGQAYLWLGETYYAKENMTAARENIIKFIGTKQGKTAEQLQKAYYLLGYTYFDAKDYNNATIYFDTFTSIDGADKSPVYDDVLNRLGDSYFNKRNFAQARKTYNKVSTSSKVADYAQYQSAFILGLQKQYNAKIELLNTLITKYPHSDYNDDAMYEIGRTYVLQDKHTEAINAYKKLQKSHPQSKLTRKASLEIGMQYANMNQNDEAIKAYKYVVENYPSSEETRIALEGLQSLYIDANKVDEYLTYRESIVGTTISTVAKSHEDSISFIAAERVYARGNYEEAIPTLTNYIVKYCDSHTFNCITAQYYLAESLYKTGDLDKALTHYNNLANLDGNEYVEPALLRASSISYDQQDYETAKRYFDQLHIVASNKNNKEIARLGILRCSYFTNKFQPTITIATEILEDIASNDDNKYEAHYCRAKAYIATGQETTAVNDLLAISNDISIEMGAEAKYLYAEHLYNQGEYKKSEDVIMQFISEGTTHQYWLARCFVLLADIYIAQGDDFMGKQYLLSLQENYSADDDIASLISVRLDAISAREAEEILQ
ncbi:MAG: tetratricopeptide repeat protein [Paludibacteraceae bacterium]|nr:tetratricopeptide repeat protein [Paludibacteraceae bacterium]